MEDVPLSVVRMARKKLKESEMRFKMSAVVYRGKRILSVGINKHKTHPTYGSGPFLSLHAEGDAIRQAVSKFGDITGSDIFIARANDNLACPCSYCKELIEKYGLRKVNFTLGEL